MRIRRVELARHRPQLEALHRECFPMDADPPWNRGDWWLVWNDKQEPIAFAGGYVHEPDGFYFLVRAGVSEHHRGMGLQRRLIRCRVRRAAQLGCKGVYSYTTLDNVQSSNNLAACGFKQWRPRRKWGGRHSVYWYRRF